MSNDISMHGNGELADRFDTDESLYGLAVASVDFAKLVEEADEIFIYNDNQLAELKQDFENGRY